MNRQERRKGRERFKIIAKKNVIIVGLPEATLYSHHTFVVTPKLSLLLVRNRFD